MTIDSLKDNLKQIKEIVRELYIFTNQLNVIKNLETSSKVVINVKEKRLLINAIIALTNQLNILNNSIPKIIHNIGFYKKLETGQREAVAVKTPSIPGAPQKKLIQVRYQPKPEEEKISLTIDDKDRLVFLENLSKSNLSISQLKKKYAVEKAITTLESEFYEGRHSRDSFERSISTQKRELAQILNQINSLRDELEASS